MKPACLLLALLLCGCEYKPRETFQLQTAHGNTLYLTCPVVDSTRSEWTYLITGQCVVEEHPPGGKRPAL